MAEAARVFNFASGPAALPLEVLTDVQRELLDWRGSGMSLLETPFTNPAFVETAENAVADLRELLRIPPDYRVLFLHGGASAQFALVPLNLLGGREKADYVDTGRWSGKAITEARRYCRVNIAASGAGIDYRAIPAPSDWRLDPDAAYCHITTNETANGVQYHWFPQTGSVPLVADMTSDFLSRPFDVRRFGLVYASAQKNLGPAGLTVVIIRDDLIGMAHPLTPSVFDYRVQADGGWSFNTPCTWAIYFAGKVLKWLRERGGVTAAAQACRRKSSLLYDAIDQSDLYDCPVAPADRSWTTVRFTLMDPSLEPEFIRRAAGQGLMNLGGHSAVGGLRASLYNAMPEAGVVALVSFMREFERRA